MGRVVINSSQYEPKPIVGYADKVSVRPGERLCFYVSCVGAPLFTATIVRLLHGDLHEDGPGLREEAISCAVNGDYAAKAQETYPGSFVLVEDASPLGDGSGDLSLQAMVFPTTPAIDRPQAVLSRWSEREQQGWALFVDGTGHLTLKVGGKATHTLSLATPMLTRLWYLVGATVNAQTGEVVLFQQPVLDLYNGRLALEHPTVDLADRAETCLGDGLDIRVPRSLRIAAWEDDLSASGRSIPGALFNGKIDRPRVANRVLSQVEMREAIESPSRVQGVSAAWDFAANVSSRGFVEIAKAVDIGPNSLHGRLINMPTRAVTGYNWDSSEHNYRHAPGQYGAIHFHDDDMTDCAWDRSFELVVPDGLRSGVYAAKVVAEVEGVAEEDYVVFFVRPAAPNKARDKILYIAPTASYLAYANDQMAAASPWGEILWGAVPQMGEQDLARQQHREYGLSLYDLHSDGSGVCYSSWLRPMLTVRPKYRPALAQVWQFNADLHLIDWLDRMGYSVDVVTDHDVHLEGTDLVGDYRVVVTGTHPEYVSGSILDALHRHVVDGGRLMYLGGNGFYWNTEFCGEDSRVVEIRRFGGTEAWTCQPGENYLSFTGELGGTWRGRGRAPQKLVGVGFVAQGLDASTYFRRMPESFDDAVRWIMSGVADDEPIGDFGLSQGGAGGIEVDWYDPNLGSPGWAHILATTEGLSRFVLEVKENVAETLPFMGADMNPNARGDMTYFKTRNGGAVFSASSIAWCGSLSHNNYDNNVSRITKNVVDGFLNQDALP